MNHGCNFVIIKKKYVLSHDLISWGDSITRKSYASHSVCLNVNIFLTKRHDFELAILTLRFLLKEIHSKHLNKNTETVTHPSTKTPVFA